MRSAAAATGRGALVGREDDLAALAALLRGGARLITLTGPGGVGKTTLAQAAAAEIAPAFADGAAAVALDAVRDPALVLPAIADAVGAALGAGPALGAGHGHGASQGAGGVPQVAALAEGRRLLLLLDNLEHLPGCVDDLAALLAAAPGIAILATSRAPLRIAGERLHPVSPLALPAEGDPDPLASPAVRLFVERALAADPGLDRSPPSLAAIAAICRGVDGLPLAIELAAGHCRTIPPVSLVSLLSPALPLLAGGPAGQPERQRALRDAIGWGFDLLPPEDRAWFERLSIFRGGFSLEGAAAVAGPDDDPGPAAAFAPVQRLADAGLLRPLPPAGGAARFGMLATVAEFGRERLDAAGARGEAEARLAAWALRLADQAGARSMSAGYQAFFDLLDAELETIRAGLAGALDRGDAAAALRLSGAFWLFWTARGHAAEARRWSDRALALAAAAPAAAGPAALVRGLLGAAWLAILSADGERAAPLAERALPLVRAHAPETLPEALCALATALAVQGRGGEGLALADEAAAAADALGQPSWAASAFEARGLALLGVGDVDGTVAAFEEAGLRWERNGIVIGSSLDSVAQVGMDLGVGRLATRLWRLSLRMPAAAADPVQSANALTGIGRVAAEDGDAALAARLLGAADRLLEDAGHAASADARPNRSEALAALADALGPGLDAALAAGRALNREEAVALALGEGPAPDSAVPVAPPAARRPSPAPDLTDRQVQVLRALAAGRSDAEIAHDLGISVRTVESHVANLYAKLGAVNRAEAAAIAVRLGWA